MAQERVLIAAPEVPGRSLLASAGRSGRLATWFHTPSSRDPTFELPHLCAALRPHVLLLIGPVREEPATLDLARESGAFVVVAVLPLERSATRNMLARQRWVCRAADAVVVPHARSVALFRDRRGRPSEVVPALDELCGHPADEIAADRTLEALCATTQRVLESKR